MPSHIHHISVHFNGERINVFPVFAGPWMKMFRYFPLPLSTALYKAVENVETIIPWLSRSFTAARHHLPSHPATQLLSKASRKI